MVSVELDIDEQYGVTIALRRTAISLLNNEIAGFFAGMKELVPWTNLSSDEHFRTDGKLLDAWASHKSFMRKDGNNDLQYDNTRNPSKAQHYHP